MRRIRAQFSRIGERWSFDVIGSDPWVNEPDEQGDVTIYRDGRGYVTSVLIDSARPGPDAREVVASYFGPEVAVLMDDTPDDDVDRIIDVDDDVSLVRGDGRVAASAVGLIADEPGVPVVVGTERYRVSLDIDVRQVSGTVEHDVAASRMRVEVGIGAEGEQLWVRVADGGSGAILALAPLREGDASNQTSSADFVFGLDVPAQLLHFSVSDDPLASPGAREERRREWAHRLEREALSMRLPRASKARRFEKAGEIFDALGESESADRCRGAVKRVRRQGRWFGGSAIVVVALVTAATGFLLGRSTPSSSAVVASVVTDPPVVRTPIEAGPVDLVFDDSRSVQVILTGDARLSAGDELRFVVRPRIATSITFERLTDCLNSESGNSLVGGDGPMYQPTFVPILENISDPTAGSRAFAPFAIDRSADTYFVVPGSCDDVWVADGTRFDAPAFVTYTAYETSIVLPDDMEPGAWKLRMVLENLEGESSTGDDITISVD